MKLQVASGQGRDELNQGEEHGHDEPADDHADADDDGRFQHFQPELRAPEICSFHALGKTAHRPGQVAAALCGGADGLDYYRAILDGWLCLLKTGGLIAFECGINQADEIKKLMRGYGIRQIRQKKDTGGIPRVVSGIKGV